MAVVINVRSTHTAVCDGLSRHELLAWVNDTLKSNFTKVDELCTGAAYCQLIHALFPNHVPIKRVKFYTNIEHEFFDNFKILQTAFQRLRVDKVIPIDRLCRGKFQDNIEFLQWFKKFYDANDRKNFYDPIAARNGLPMGYGALTLKRNIEKRHKTISPIRDKFGEKNDPVVDVQPSTESSSETGVTLKRSLTRTEFKKIPLKTERVNSLGRIDAINCINLEQGSHKVLTKANEFYRLRIKEIEQNLMVKERETVELRAQLTEMEIVQSNRNELLKRLQDIMIMMDNSDQVEDMYKLKNKISKILKEFEELPETKNKEMNLKINFGEGGGGEDCVENEKNYGEDDEENCDADCEIDDSKEIYVDANEIDFEANKLESTDLEIENDKILNKI